MISIENKKLDKFSDFNEINNFQIVLDKYHKLLKLKIDPKELTTYIESIYLKAEYSFLLGNFEQAIHLFELIKSVSISPEHIRYNLISQIGMAKSCLEKSEYHHALLFIEQGEFLFHQVDEQLLNHIYKPLALLFHLKGQIFYHLGEMDESLKYFEESTSFASLAENQTIITDNLVYIGHVHQYLGDLTTALNYFQQAIKYYHMLDRKHKEAMTLNDIGFVYRLRGEIQQAKECFNESIEIFTKYNNLKDILFPKENLAFINALEGNLEDSYNSLVEILSGKLKIGNLEEISKTLFYMIRVAIASERTSEVDNLFSDFKNLVKSNQTNMIVDSYWALSKALIHKFQGRLREIVQAQQGFQQILASGVVSHELMVIATMNLCEILVYELTFNGEEETFEEAKMLINSILKIAQQQNSIILLIEAFVIQSKFAIIEGDTDKANQLLVQAKLNSEELGLKVYSDKIHQEQKSLEAQISKWIEITKQNASISEKIQETRLIDYIRDLHKL